MSTDRDFRAFVVSVPTAVVGWMCVAFAWLAAIDGLAAAARDIPTLLVGGAVVGTWVSLGAVVFLAGPLYIACELAGQVCRSVVLIGGVSVGCVTALFAGAILDAGGLLSPTMGGVIGLFTAVIWWRSSGRS